MEGVFKFYNRSVSGKKTCLIALKRLDGSEIAGEIVELIGEEDEDGKKNYSVETEVREDEKEIKTGRLSGPVSIPDQISKQLVASGKDENLGKAGRYCSNEEKSKKVAVVSVSNAVVCPRAVVVHFENASVEEVEMMLVLASDSCRRGGRFKDTHF